MATLATAASPADDRGRSAESPSEIPARGWRDIAKRTYAEAQKDNTGIVAAGVAFYFFLALVPLLGATVLTYGLFVTPETVARQAAGLTHVLPGEAAKLIGDQLTQVTETSGGKKGFGLLFAIGLAFWGARNAASAIVTALNIAYEEEEKRGFVKTTLLSLAMTIGAVVMAGVVAAATGMLSSLERWLPDMGAVGQFLVGLLTYAILAAVAAAAAATLYRYGPSREKARWTWLTPGSIFFAGVWLVLTLGFGFYVRNFGNYGATYGSLSAPVVLLTWLYLSSYVLIYGAEFNSEVERQAETATSSSRSEGGGGGPSTPKAPPSALRAPSSPSLRDGEVGEGRDHSYLTSRIASRAGQLAGARKISMVSSGLATLGLGFLRKRGREGVGAALLVTAAGLALLRRR